MHIGVRKMKNNIWIIFYLFILFLIIFFEYQKKTIATQVISNYNYEIKENNELDKLLLEYTKQLDENISIDKLWNIVLPKAKVEKKEKKVDKIEGSSVEVTLKDKTICIAKKCFKFLGIFLDKSYASSFYIKDNKNKVQTFIDGEILNSTIKIKKIEKNSIVFNDINSTREWSIKLFDINSSKYKPKEFR